MGGAVGILLCNFTVPRLLGRRKYEFRVQPFPDFIGGRPGSTHTEEHKEWLRERFSGEGNPMYGKPVPDEVRKKLSEALKGREFSEETIKKMKEARKGEKHPYYGKTFPDEWIANLSKALSGKNNPNYGVKMSDEQKKKLSIANSGENHPMYGKEITDEHNLWIIEDACHALGGEWVDKTGTPQKVGNCSHSDMTIFSFP